MAQSMSALRQRTNPLCGSAGVVSIRDVTRFRDRRDIAVYRIDRFERNQLRRVLIEIAQLALEIAWIVVREDAGFAAAVADTLDHRGVVEFVR